MEPVAHYTHIQNVRAENAIRVAKEHIRWLLRASNLPKILARKFWVKIFLAICLDALSQNACVLAL
jgi:hypothetical protein